MTTTIPTTTPTTDDTGTSGDSPLCHVADSCCEPYTRTLCGLPIDNPEDYTDTSSYASPEDCVVCLEMDRTSTRCPQCGHGLRPSH